MRTDPQSTASASNEDASGYATNQSQNGPRRSSRVTTPVQSRTLISTPADSRRSLVGAPNASANKRLRQVTASPQDSVVTSSQGTLNNQNKQQPINKQRKNT
ncbi:hypothetical protein PGT21_022277 [Puccinia graminis f. sp. tritici]|uniref:Uncharacterized protein n=1 Tax=Puccinia graminis f. sp. tritici TaxID=56615 RepID=A0A5B0P8I5_PUCGR|nr:hypothetical protein PGT21_022277 [Puccinia graminis f. sp. tritici]KAA1097042.1 hypothetical protein PGTUg99_003266 [Puccinia graminis f. sp. tritici]